MSLPHDKSRPNVILLSHFIREEVDRLKLDTKTRIAKRMNDVRGEAAFQMFGRATELERQGRSIIHLEIGEPDFGTPPPVVDPRIEWLNKGATHYFPPPEPWELSTPSPRPLH